ncbi:inositol polyphosphate kinase family protein [Streptomyces sp. CA-135486]|uniref:inositol polyphosphate kinase family protein n=1 Tax=Streptomyces sp. CA-135486 TaxID=3240049 RepID=UPI003D8F9001
MTTPPGETQHAAVNQGGHGAIKPIGDGSILAKSTPRDSIESEFYARIRQGEYPLMTPVVPTSYTAQQVRDLQPRLTAEQAASLNDQTHVYFENMAQGDMKKLDAKVGDKTSSRRELTEQHGMSSAAAAWKEMKLSVVDWATKSAERGWRVVGGDDAPDSRLKAGRESMETLRQFSDDPQVWKEVIGKMEGIRNAAEQSDLGFIASSVFSVQGTRDGNQVVDAKLIDFAHVIDANHPLTQTTDVTAVDSRQNSPEQSTSTSRPNAGTEGATAGREPSQKAVDLKDKYRDKFLAGMDNLIKAAETVRAEKEQANVAGAANMRGVGATVTAGTSASATPVAVASTSSQQVVPRR